MTTALICRIRQCINELCMGQNTLFWDLSINVKEKLGKLFSIRGHVTSDLLARIEVLFLPLEGVRKTRYIMKIHLWVRDYSLGSRLLPRSGSIFTKVCKSDKYLNTRYGKKSKILLLSKMRFEINNAFGDVTIRTFPSSWRNEAEYVTWRHLLT